MPDAGYDPRVRGAALGALRDELMYFCACVREHRQPEIITPREAKNAVRVALALIESANRDGDVQITELGLRPALSESHRSTHPSLSS